MDRETIRGEAKRQVAEPDDNGFWTDAQYNSCIERAQDDFAIKTKCLKTYAEFTTAADTREYNFNEASLANFIKIAEVYYFTDDDNYERLHAIDRDELSVVQNQNIGVTATPQYFCYEDRVLEFDVNTEADLTVRVYYYKLPDALSADSSVSNIPTKFHQALVYYTCWKFCESDESNTSRIGYFKEEYLEEISKAMMILHPSASSYGQIKDDTQVPWYGR